MYQMEFSDELVIDNFAGGGGASSGIEKALNRPIDYAINHDPEAVALHQANHPHTKHFCEDIWEVNPRELVNGRRVGLVWLSPDCKHFSKAKGSKPVEKKIRGLAWIALRWASLPRPSKPRVIMLENVSEFMTWGRIVDGKPSAEHKGETFRSFVNALKRQGYEVEWRVLKACDYGAPTIRERLFMVARSDGQPIVWPAPTHGDGLKPYVSAGECIDFSVPGNSIFTRKRPLVENTMNRIARGIKKFIVEDENPFVVPTGTGMIAPFLTEHANGSGQRIFDIRKPLNTQCAEVKGGHFALVAPYIMKMRGDNTGHRIDEPLHTISAGGMHHALVNAFLLKYYGRETCGFSLNEPLGTVTTKDRFALVTVHGHDYMIFDIKTRMLRPRELYTAQSFNKDYKIQIPYKGKPLSIKSQVRMCGNSVPPKMAEVMTRANVCTNTLYTPARAVLRSRVA